MTMNLVLLNLGYFLILVALIIPEILWLRITLTVAQGILFTNAVLNNNVNQAGWNSVFVVVNVIQIVLIFRDRQELAIPEEIRDLYDDIFYRISNREFLHFWHRGQQHEVSETSLIKEGDSQNDLMLILHGNANVFRGDKKVACLKRGQFIAEISYITGKEATADVAAEDGLIYHVWTRATLEQLQKSRPATMDKLEHILSMDMAEKLAH